ncbi:MAG: MATE family efflux transporter [Fusobacterium sp.]
MKNDLINGNITKSIITFAVPMIIGNFLQQFYNIADTIIIGKFLGSSALAAVGSSYAFMIFLTSILLGLCMGSSALFSIEFGRKNIEKLKNDIIAAFVLIGILTIFLNILSFLFIDKIIMFMKIPKEIYNMTKDYLNIIFYGIIFTFLYNYFSFLLRALGNSVTPLLFLVVSALTNIFLDLWFVINLNAGVKGAAYATVISQGISGIGIFFYVFYKFPWLIAKKKEIKITKSTIKEISEYSFLTCIQQSVMNLGILMVQGLINSFGTNVMAAFTAAVKIDSLAYMPVQDFGNSFSTFVAQNFGAEKIKRIEEGIKKSVNMIFIFCIFISASVFIFAEKLMLIFINPSETEILSIGIQYLRIEGIFYWGIGFLFLLYGFYRAVKKPEMSVILTIISLGTRVILAYSLSSIEYIGILGIWWSVPIGWILADIFGYFYYKKYKNVFFRQ